MPTPQFFVFGRTPALSAAELAAVLARTRRRLPPVLIGRGFLVTSEPLGEPTELIARLGGIVKIGRVVHRGPALTGVPLAERIAESLAAGPTARRRVFGVSFLSGQHRQRVRRLLLAIKEQLGARDIRARYVQSEQDVLSSVVVERERLITEGAEILIGDTETEQVIAVTEAVQPFAALSARDYGRPRRNELAGLLPPKLAIAMLNLSRLGPEATVLDPFCGSGTVLQEAELLGFRTLIGTDASADAVGATRENLRWLLDHAAVDRSTVSLKLHVASIETLPTLLGEHSVDGIVTEPFLGPPLRRTSHPGIITKAVQTTSLLYRTLFATAGRLLRPGGVLVTIVPMFRTGKQSFREPVYDTKPLTPLELLPPVWGFPTAKIVYGRPDQHVFRKIVAFRKG